MEIFTQICLGIKHLHDGKVMHRDLKGQNIFLTSKGKVKIGDLGVSKVMESTLRARTQIGTPYYMSPELVKGLPYTFKSDIWSLGVILYELCTLQIPFEGQNIFQLGKQITNSQPKPLPAFYSEMTKSLVAAMLEKREAYRPTISEILKRPMI